MDVHRVLVDSISQVDLSGRGLLNLDHMLNEEIDSYEDVITLNLANNGLNVLPRSLHSIIPRLEELNLNNN